SVLYPPLTNPEAFRCEKYGDYIFYPSRITRSKRQHLLIESFQHTQSNTRLIIAGSPETQDDLSDITTLIQSRNLENKIIVIPRFVSEDEKIRLFADALACAYIPLDDDSCGYVTLESYASRKAVITCGDSGGTLDLVRDRISGFVVTPEPEAMAKAIDRLAEDRRLAESMGQTGHQTVIQRGISWKKVVETLCP